MGTELSLNRLSLFFLFKKTIFNIRMKMQEASPLASASAASKSKKAKLSICASKSTRQYQKVLCSTRSLRKVQIMLNKISVTVRTNIAPIKVSKYWTLFVEYIFITPPGKGPCGSFTSPLHNAYARFGGVFSGGVVLHCTNSR